MECCNMHGKEALELKKQIPDEDIVVELSDFFKLFGDSTRIKILSILIKHEACVSALVDLLDMKQSAISHQLKILKAYRIVKTRKENKYVFYSLDDEHIERIYNMGLEHVYEKFK